MSSHEHDLIDSELEGMTLMRGTIQVHKRLAQGGMAWVYKATDVPSGTKIALKILFSQYARSPQMRARFLREARIQRDTLQHPNILKVLQIIEDRGLLGFTMEWCDHGDLRSWQRAYQAPLSKEHLLAFFPPLIEAVGSAHQKGVIHRDLKPQNILLQVQGEQLLPKIADFGIAKILSGQSNTKTGSLIGTLAYMSPEQMEDSKHIDHRADIYSMGVILYLMATARLPFEGKGPHNLAKILYEAPPVPREAPPALQSVILKCLEKKPHARYATCEELKEAVEDALLRPEQATSLNLPSDLAEKISEEEWASQPTLHPDLSELQTLDNLLEPYDTSKSSDKMNTLLVSALVLFGVGVLIGIVLYLR